MLHSPIIPSLDALSQAIARTAPEADASGSFPHPAFDVLRKASLIANPPLGRGTTPDLLLLLSAVGKGDLNVGRIYEGHVNAVWLVRTYGSQAQAAALQPILDQGGILGVWNTDAPGHPLERKDDVLQGRKNFASGVDGLSHAIITTTENDQRHMLLVPLSGLPVDRSWWKPVGMKASGSHIVDFTGLALTPDMTIGQGNDYIVQPWFSAGALRFLAVQMGGVEAVFDSAKAHLLKTNRADNPFQAHRLARMGAAVETGHLWIERLGRAWIEAEDEGSERAFNYLLSGVNGARLTIERLALDVLTEAEQAIGAAGMIAPHPFERLMRDLRTYLRQPNPDGAAAQFGQAIAAGDWAPGRGDGA